ncbi:MAG: tetratricopeptide repeat protein [Caldilineaceae bacterium]|nr:tetratricopeptide repeat protein [Caldilineaceae bacterium]MBP8108391.1 tetratricopeptide repeat protein [Caldilineaceae bacterium]MBP8125039.1 tetratricopeptide repeat protein [Caldilineaceae bacterium]MBP9072454.1 tetratricopeptide repeat protein [Caldilineaceae bacterium]
MKKQDPTQPNPELTGRRRRLIEQAARLDSDAAAAQALTAALNESAHLLQANQPVQAVALLHPWHVRQPTHPDLAINLGGAYILQRKWDMAIDALEAAAQAHLDNPMLWTNLAAAYLGALETASPKRQGQAIAAYEQALAADPQAPNVHYHLGLIYVEQRAWVKAQSYFQAALAVQPQDRDAQRWLDRIAAMLSAKSE